jgi:hypothetical protein
MGKKINNILILIEKKNSLFQIILNINLIKKILII